MEKVETNILIFQLNQDISDEYFLKKMSEHNVKLISMGDNKLRLVTHKRLFSGNAWKIFKYPF